VLSGDGNPASNAAVALNAAAAFYVSGQVPTFDEGVAVAREAIAAGVGLGALDRLRTAFQAR
jgi:anthranilate phosphoribosyltransferase